MNVSFVSLRRVEENQNKRKEGERGNIRGEREKRRTNDGRTDERNEREGKRLKSARGTEEETRYSRARS